MTPSHLPRVLLTSCAKEQLGKVDLSRSGLVVAMTAIHVSLPAMASRYRNTHRLPRGKSGFVYRQNIRDGERARKLVLVVGDAGWPDLLWVVDLFVVDG